ncbi:hypothetical protein [Streptomyces carpinensis]|nr:hypothetical protein [Streptomyces carpinensis]
MPPWIVLNAVAAVVICGYGEHRNRTVRRLAWLVGLTSLACLSFGWTW